MAQLTRGTAILCALVLLVTGAVAAQQAQPQRGGTIVIALFLPLIDIIGKLGQAR